MSRTAPLLICLALTTALVAVDGPALAVDAAAGDAPIDPAIYGMNFPDADLAAELGMAVARWGGNSTTRYNYQLDVSCKGSDWFFLSIGGGGGTDLPDDASVNRVIDANAAGGVATLVTMPLIGWTPKQTDKCWSYSVAKYGAQQVTEADWLPTWGSADAGNGILTNGTPITWNDPTDTCAAIGTDWITGWIAHLRSRHGTAVTGGVRHYSLDNEPMLWSHTHRDVHPERLGYDELWTRTSTSAPAIKAAEPGALTFGPVLWGWTAYFYSDLDQGDGGSWWSTRSDRRAHGDVPLAQWYLRQAAAWEAVHGTRILDYFDLHFYPQENAVALSGAGDATTQALRLRSTRNLWDPTYTSESWIGESVQLIPRMKQWIADEYPGTRTAITEYNWGALDHINGALAQADILGIFGREGLDLATLWAPPSPSQPGAWAFRMYRNYNGSGGRFGDRRRTASSADQGVVAVYAAGRTADNALTVMLVNKTGSTRNCALTLANLTTGGTIAAVYRYAAADTSQIVQLADLPVTNGSNAISLAENAVVLLVIPDSGNVTPPVSRTIGMDNPPGRVWQIDPGGTGTPGSGTTVFDDLDGTTDHLLWSVPTEDG